MHELGLGLYYGREFAKALSCFTQVEQFLPGDSISARFVERCRQYIKTPPGPKWDGVEIITEK
jgi:adenylate cyclase